MLKDDSYYDGKDGVVHRRRGFSVSVLSADSAGGLRRISSDPGLFYFDVKKQPSIFGSHISSPVKADSTSKNTLKPSGHPIPGVVENRITLPTHESSLAQACSASSRLPTPKKLPRKSAPAVLTNNPGRFALLERSSRPSEILRHRHRAGLEDISFIQLPNRNFSARNQFTLHPHRQFSYSGASRRGDAMAAGFQRVSGDARRFQQSGYVRAENRAPMNSILCRNGPQCRKFQEGTCNYNHDFSAIAANGLAAAKKTLNVDSPTFTPTFTPKAAYAQPAKVGISPKAVNAAAFTPRGGGSATPATDPRVADTLGDYNQQTIFQPTQQFNEFVPGQNFIPHQLESQNSLHGSLNPYNDPFMTQANITGLDGTNTQINPYTQQSSSVSAQQYFHETPTYPLNYHLYAPVGPRRENLTAYQRSTTDFFLPDNLREELQRKADASLQVFANSTLPLTVEYFHSLVALDTNTQKGPSTFGYPTWLYKATSSRDGHIYCLRRIEGFRLTNELAELAIRTVQNWKRVTSGGIVQIYDAFTGKWFNDSSLIIVTDYHPMAQTLAERHLGSGRPGVPSRASSAAVPENDLWMYIVQIASALKVIHDNRLAAQTVIGSKVLVTSKNRLRLSGCGVLDIVQYESGRPVADLQRADLEDLGRLILGVAARHEGAHHSASKNLELVSRSYTERLRACISWLLAPPSPQQERSESPPIPEYNVNTLLHNIADKVVSAFDSALHQEDTLTTALMRELENGRIVRLLTKLNIILERPDINATAPGGANLQTSTSLASLNQPSSAWSETGERYYLKLFRDYVFHQIDADGRPVLDLGHILTCLNKLDAGIDEKIQLVSRDEQNVFIVSYREVKRGFETAWAEISKAAARR